MKFLAIVLIQIELLKSSVDEALMDKNKKDIYDYLTIEHIAHFIDLILVHVLFHINDISWYWLITYRLQE